MPEREPPQEARAQEPGRVREPRGPGPELQGLEQPELRQVQGLAPQQREPVSRRAPGRRQGRRRLALPAG